MRIQFTVSQSEWNTLEMKSIKEGYPDVPSYCKDMVLKQRTYAMLWNTVTKKRLNHKFCGISDSSRSSVGSYRIASERNIRHQDIRIPVCEES